MMEEPYGGKVNIQLVVRRFKHKVLYYVHEFDGSIKYFLKPCVLSESSIRAFPFVRFFDDKMNLDMSYSQGANWKRLFDIFEDAEKEVRRLNGLYFDGFRYKPYMKISELEQHKQELVNVEKLIDKMLSNFDNYEGIDFCNVGANGTQIRLHNREIDGYTHGRQITIKKDYSNIDDVAIQVVNAWLESDIPSRIYDEKRMIASCEKYGWD